MPKNNALFLSLLGNYITFKPLSKGKRKIDFVICGNNKIGDSFVRYYVTELRDLLDYATLQKYDNMLKLLSDSYTFSGVDSLSSSYAVIAVWYDRNEKIEVTCSISKNIDALSPIVVSDENGHKFRSFFFSTREKLIAFRNTKKVLCTKAVAEALRVLDLRLVSEYNAIVNANSKNSEKEYKEAV